MLDAERGHAVTTLQLYVTVKEASELRQSLDALLKDPEQNEHRHVLDGAVDLSFSIVTERKLGPGARYTAVERAVLGLK